MRTKNDLTAETLRSLFNYDPTTGGFTRIQRRGPFKQGSIAGTTLNTGYVAIIILGTPYQAHRLAWLYMTGYWPKKWIDHINHIKDDNRFENLRDVTWSVNQHNLSGAKKTNQSGFLGVSPYKGKWVAQIQKNKTKQHIGVYETPEQAHSAYLEAKALLHRP